MERILAYSDPAEWSGALTGDGSFESPMYLNDHEAITPPPVKDVHDSCTNRLRIKRRARLAMYARGCQDLQKTFNHCHQLMAFAEAPTLKRDQHQVLPVKYNR